MNDVPTIDVSKIDKNALQLVDRACRDHGFFKLVGHGLNDLIDRMWSQTELFFSASQDFKYTLMRPADSAFGYFNREMTKLKRDQKETFDYHGLKTDAVGKSASDFWPRQNGGDLAAAGLQEFEAVLKEFYWANTRLAEQTLALVCRALGENTDALQGMFGSAHTTLARLNHSPCYDPLPEKEHTPGNALGDMALHEHTDPGALTLLYQDNVGGLQTLSSEHGWIDVPPEAYSFVVNLGDLMQVWSNDRYQAAAHRVRPVPSGTSRYSIPFFYSPRYDAVIEPIVTGEPPRYRPFSWYEFATARVADNYQNLGKADTHVTDYRLSA